MFISMKKKLLLAGAVGLLTLLLVSCGGYVFTKSAGVDEVEAKNSILVYGYVDDSEAPFDMQWATIKQVKPIIKDPYLEMRSNREQLFYLENLPIGSYLLESIHGVEKGFFGKAVWTWGFPNLATDPEFKKIQLKARKPGLYYMGSYKMHLVKKGGFFSSDVHRLDVSETPTEKEVLKKLLKHTKGTKWHTLVKRRIAQL